MTMKKRGRHAESFLFLFFTIMNLKVHTILLGSLYAIKHQIHNSLRRRDINFPIYHHCSFPRRRYRLIRNHAYKTSENVSAAPRGCGEGTSDGVGPQQPKTSRLQRGSNHFTLRRIWRKERQIRYQAH